LEYFDIDFLDEALEFLDEIPLKVKNKILFNIALAKSRRDPKLFKHLMDDIWYFRTLYQGNHYRIFAFWDKTNKQKTLVIACHGIVKKSAKPEKSEILKTKNIRKKYFENKDK
jgi:phage-related protein